MSNYNLRTQSSDEGIAGLPILHYPPRMTTPDILRGARTHEHRRQASAHAAMVAQASTVYQVSPSEAIRAFALISPSRTVRALVSLEEEIPIPLKVNEPIPIPPRIDTPYPEDINPAETPESPALEDIPALPHPDSPVPPYSPEGLYHVRSPTPYKAPSTPSDAPRDSPAPHQHPGHNWLVNQQPEGWLHEVEVPTGPNEYTMAPFVRYDFDTDSPELLATLGRGCGVHSTMLRARKAPYPTPVFTKKERYLFHPQEAFSPIVSKAVDELRDVMLRAEVHRYRRFTRRAERMYRQLGDLHRECKEAAQVAYQSQERLAEADAYIRVTDHVQNHLDEPTHPEMRRRYEARLRRMVDSSKEEPELTVPRCSWCLRTGHDAQ